MKKLLYIVVFMLTVLFVAFLASPVSYFLVKFNTPLSADEYLEYLRDNDINPKQNMVYVLHSALDQPEGLSDLDITNKSGKFITDTVFNTRPYALKALFDKRVSSWEFAGPRHPYD